MVVMVIPTPMMPTPVLWGTHTGLTGQAEEGQAVFFKGFAFLGENRSHLGKFSARFYQLSEFFGVPLSALCSVCRTRFSPPYRGDAWGVAAVLEAPREDARPVPVTGMLHQSLKRSQGKLLKIVLFFLCDFLLEVSITFPS